MSTEKRLKLVKAYQFGMSCKISLNFEKEKGREKKSLYVNPPWTELKPTYIQKNKTIHLSLWCNCVHFFFSFFFVVFTESSQLHNRFKPFISIIPYRFRLENLDETLKDKLTIECGTPERPNEDIELISSLRIKRILVEARIGPPSIKNPELLVEAQNSGDRQAKIRSAGGSHNYTVSGEVPRSENEGRISITFKQAGCWDSADYVCEFIRTDITRSVSHLESSTKLLTGESMLRVAEVDGCQGRVVVVVGGWAW